ncbi:uncharacterized protein METZ01_LOCUS470684, partial [marine metagenome]
MIKIPANSNGNKIIPIKALFRHLFRLGNNHRQVIHLFSVPRKVLQRFKNRLDD